MTDATTRFFDTLSRRRHEPMLARVSGSARFDVLHDGDIEHWTLRIAKGDIEVSRDVTDADCVVRADRAQLEDLVAGRVNAMSELLRGGLAVEGDPELLVLMQRLFGARTEADSEASERGRSS
jgi:putative sterol carrier protein